MAQHLGIFYTSETCIKVSLIQAHMDAHTHTQFPLLHTLMHRVKQSSILQDFAGIAETKLTSHSPHIRYATSKN